MAKLEMLKKVEGRFQKGVNSRGDHEGEGYKGGNEEKKQKKLIVLRFLCL